MKAYVSKRLRNLLSTEDGKKSFYDLMEGRVEDVRAIDDTQKASVSPRVNDSRKSLKIYLSNVRSEGCE